MAEAKTVTLPDNIVGAVKNDFVVGKTVELSDGREIECMKGKPKFKQVRKIGKAMGADDPDMDDGLIMLAVLATRIRVKGTNATLSFEELDDLDFDDTSALLEAALGKKKASHPHRPSQP